jgi:hypothetical protein
MANGEWIKTAAGQQRSGIVEIEDGLTAKFSP